MKSKIIFLLLLLTAFKTFGSKINTQTLFKDKDVIWGFDFLTKEEIIYSLRSGEHKIFNIKTRWIYPGR